MKKYIISSYIPNSETNRDALDTLMFMALEIGAELKVHATKANYKKEQYSIPDYITPQEAGYYLNNNLYVSDLLVNHNLIDPLTGLESISSEKGSLIIPTTRHRFKSVARSLKHHKSPRGMWCTGSISYPNYKDTKSGMRVKGYHVYGALLVEIVDSERFNIRQLTYCPKSQSIFDLNKEYTLSGHVNSIRPSISLGDLHPPFTSKFVLKETKKLLKDLNVEKAVLHDSFDACSISHHVEGKHITKALIYDKIPSLEEEIKITADTMNDLFDGCSAKVYLAKSNHDEHLDRYLDEFRFKDEHSNLIYSLELARQKVMYHRGLSDKDALEYALHNAGLKEGFIFLKREDTLNISGNECGNHGDYGPNGAGGNGKVHGLSFSGGNVVTGHAHTPEIGVYGNYVNGTMTELSLPYTNDSGTTGWINTHTLIYPNGTKSHYHIIQD